MKTKPTLLALCTFSCALPCAADTFTLKDGTTLEGKILSEAPDSYVLEVQVTKSIKDERKVAKAEIAKIGVEQPDLKAFEAIAKLVPTQDLLTDADYGQSIGAVQKFLKDFPSSSQSKQAKAMLETLRSESTQVAAGGIKFKGNIVTPDQYQSNAYELDARVVEAKIRTLAGQNQYLAALRTFSEFERDYRSTLAFGSVIPLIQQVIKNQVAEAKQSLLTIDAREKQRMAGLTRMSSEARGATESAIKEEAAALAVRYKAEKDAKITWVTTDPFHKVSLEETVKFGESELARLAAVKTTLGVDGGKAYREAHALIHSGGGSTASITTALTAAKTAGVSARYLANLEADAKLRK